MVEELKSGMTGTEKADWLRRAVESGYATSLDDARFIMAVALGDIPGDAYGVDENGRPIPAEPSKINIVNLVEQAEHKK